MRQAPHWWRTSRRRVAPGSAGRPGDGTIPPVPDPPAPPPRRLPVVLDCRVRFADAADGAFRRRSRLRGGRLRAMGAGPPAGGEDDGYRIVRVASNWRMAVPGLRRRGSAPSPLARPPGAPRPAGAPASRKAGPRGSRHPQRHARPASSGDRRRGGGPFLAARDPEADPASRSARWVGPSRSRRSPSPPKSGTGCGPDRCRPSADSGDDTAAARSTTAVTCTCTSRASTGCTRGRGVLRRSTAAGPAGDAVITVNDAYADILERTLQIARPAIVMNCPERWIPPEPRPDHIREALSLPTGQAACCTRATCSAIAGSSSRWTRSWRCRTLSSP